MHARRDEAPRDHLPDHAAHLIGAAEVDPEVVVLLQYRPGLRRLQEALELIAHRLRVALLAAREPADQAASRSAASVAISASGSRSGCVM